MDMWPKTDVTKKITVKSFRSCFEKHFPADETYYFNGESHNFWEMVYITDGEWVVSADDRIYNLTEGHIIFHKPMEFHKLWKTSNSRAGCFVCSFDAEGDCSFLEEKVFKVNIALNECLRYGICSWHIRNKRGRKLSILYCRFIPRKIYTFV